MEGMCQHEQMWRNVKQAPATTCRLYHPPCWCNHIESYGKEQASLPEVKTALAKCGPADVEDTVEVELPIMTMMTCISLDLRRREAKRLREERLAKPEWKKGKTLRLSPSAPPMRCETSGRRGGYGNVTGARQEPGLGILNWLQRV